MKTGATVTITIAAKGHEKEIFSQATIALDELITASDPMRTLYFFYAEALRALTNSASKSDPHWHYEKIDIKPEE